MNIEFHSAVDRGDVGAVRSFLLKLPELVKDRRKYDFLALHQAVDKDDLEMVKLLLEFGAEVNGINDEEVSSLHLAHSPEMVHLLCDRGAEVNCRSSRGWTPLYNCVCRPDEIEVLRAIIERGGDPAIPDNIGQLPIDAAVLREEPEKVCVLRQHRGGR